MIKKFQNFLFKRFFFSSNMAYVSDLLLVDHPEALSSIVLSSASLVPRGLLCKTDVLALQINTSFASKMDIIITEQGITGGFV